MTPAGQKAPNFGIVTSVVTLTPPCYPRREAVRCFEIERRQRSRLRQLPINVTGDGETARVQRCSEFRSNLDPGLDSRGSSKPWAASCTTVTAKSHFTQYNFVGREVLRGNIPSHRSTNPGPGLREGRKAELTSCTQPQRQFSFTHCTYTGCLVHEVCCFILSWWILYYLPSLFTFIAWKPY